MRKPTFFILGAPKCGTTAIAQYMASHPDVFLSSPKEPHFFDGNYEKGVASYLHDHFARWGNELAAGEATPSYFAVPFAAERIRHDVPDAKLIVMLRDPTSRAFSSWWMLHVRGMESLSFADAIAAERLQSASGHPLEKANAVTAWEAHVEQIRAGKQLDIRTYLHTGHYAIHLRRYFQLFPKQNIKIIFSHQLRENPEKVIRDLWSFIGVDSQAPLPDFEAVNEALGAGVKPVLKWIQIFGLMRLRGMFPESIRAWLKEILARIGGRPEMELVIKKHLVEYFEPHICELELLLGEDLSVWRR
jgi:hypothetical protein